MRIIHRLSTVLAHRAIILFGLLALCFQSAIAEGRAVQAVFASEQASDEVCHIYNEIVNAGDNKNMPFVILDKKQAKIFMFQKDGQLLGAAPALLGIAVGDKYFPGTGQKKLSLIRVEERTTPAGRFHAVLGYNSHQEEVLWVDFDMAIAIHPVVTSNPKEHRLERLESPKPKDHRISFGCINVPKKFYSTCISPLFTGDGGTVYVLPDVLNIEDVFGTSFQASSR